MATTTIKLKRDTAANWASENTVLAQGEPGFESDTGKYKVGDGSTAWNSLDYMVPFRNIESSDGTVKIEATNTANVVTGDLLPATDTSSDIGSISKQFKDMYLSGTTLYIGGKPTSLSSDGKMAVDIADASLYGKTPVGYGVGAIAFDRTVSYDSNGNYLQEQNYIDINNINLSASTLAAVGTYVDAEPDLAAVNTNPAFYQFDNGFGIVKVYRYYFTKVVYNSSLEVPDNPGAATINVSNFSGGAYGNLNDPQFTINYDGNGDILSWELTAAGDPVVFDSILIDDGANNIADGGLAVQSAVPKTIATKVSETPLPAVKLEDPGTFATATLSIDTTTASTSTGISGVITVTDATSGAVGTITATSTSSADIIAYGEFDGTGSVYGNVITSSPATNLNLSYVAGTHDYTFDSAEADADYIVNVTYLGTPPSGASTDIVLMPLKWDYGFQIQIYKLEIDFVNSTYNMVLVNSSSDEPQYAVTVYRMR